MDNKSENEDNEKDKNINIIFDGEKLVDSIDIPVLAQEISKQLLSVHKKKKNDDDDDEDEKVKLNKKAKKSSNKGVKNALPVVDPLKFSVLCEIPELIDTDDIVLDDIEILREGKFEHPVYGTLDFNLKLFDTLIRNFKNNVLSREISFDKAHNPSEGAVAWVKNLFLSQREIKGKLRNVLNARFEWNPIGLQLRRDKVYKYFSSEFVSNFTEPETGKEFGEVLTGGGLTNRPFISGLRPFVFSEETEETQLFNEIETVQYKEEKKSPSVVFNIQLSEEQRIMNTADKVRSIIEKAKSGDSIDMSELDELQSELDAFLNPVDDKPKDETEDKVEEEIELTPVLSEDVSKTLSEYDSKFKKLTSELEKAQNNLSVAEDDRKKLSDSVEELLSYNKTLKGEKILSENEAIEGRLKRAGHSPAVLSEAMSIIKSPGSRDNVVELSEFEDGVETKMKLNAADIVMRVLNVIPKHQRLDLSETSEQFSDEDSNFSKTDSWGGFELEGINDPDSMVKAMQRANIKTKTQLNGDGK